MRPSTDHPAPTGAPRAVLVHGAVSDPGVFDGWLPRWAGFDVRVPDLQDGGDLAMTTMADYAERVVGAGWGDDPGTTGETPVVLCGWSMGGLVAMLAALRRTPAALVVVEPSVLSEVGGEHPEVRLETGTYGAEVYGAEPSGDGRKESLLARCERKRGISVPHLPCPTLVLAGRDFPDRGRPVAERYGAALREYPALGHRDLVTDPAVADDVVAWVHRTLAG